MQTSANVCARLLAYTSDSSVRAFMLDQQINHVVTRFEESECSKPQTSIEAVFHRTTLLASRMSINCEINHTIPGTELKEAPTRLRLASPASPIGAPVFLLDSTADTLQADD